MPTPILISLTLAALIFGAILVGAGLYETILVDQSWPQHLEIIQPHKGGINRKNLWMPAHVVFEITLLSVIWLAWSAGEPCRWLIVSLVAHVATRAWSFVYCIPAAIRFEAIEADGETHLAEMHRWVRLSRLRVLMEAIAVISIALGLVQMID